VQLCGYDSVDFALPMEGNRIRELHRETIDNKWTLPPFNITSGEKQQEHLK